jgi:hypothetical protein
MVLGWTQLLREMSKRYISFGVKAAGVYGLPLSCADCLETWEPQPPTALSACPGQYMDFFTFTTGIISVNADKFSIMLFQCILT